MIKIAAHNSSMFSKDNADIVCDGNADESEIKAAIELLPESGGHIALSDGDFVFSEMFPTSAKQLMITGAGMRSTILSFPNVENCIEPSSSWTIRDIEIVGGGGDYGIKMLPVHYCLFERIYISGVVKAGVRGESGNSQNTFNNVIVSGEPEYGFNYYGSCISFNSCQAMRTNDKGGGVAGFNLHLTGGSLSGCVVEDWGAAFRFDNYCDKVSVFHPHVEGCLSDFVMTGSAVAPKNIRVFGGFHGGVVTNPQDMDIVFYE